MGKWAKDNPVVALMTPVRIVGVPLFDNGFVGASRIVGGQVHSIHGWLGADKDHLHHCFEALGMSRTEGVLSILFLSATLGISAILLRAAAPTNPRSS